MLSFIWYIQIMLCQSATVMVAGSLSPIIRLCQLIGVYVVGAILYIILGFPFLGQTYIIVYVGAIAIQFQFVIMMIPAEPAQSAPQPKLSQMKLKFLPILWGAAAVLTLQIGISLFFPLPPVQSFIKNLHIWAYSHPSWSKEFLFFHDQYTQGLYVYQVAPLAQVLISIAQFVTMQGVIAVTT